MNRPCDLDVFCLWCERRLTDGRVESGFTGVGPDWMDDGDFGCDESPDTGPDGAGSHTPDILATWDGHLVRVRRVSRREIEHLHDDSGDEPVPVPAGYRPHGVTSQRVPEAVA